MNQLLIMDGIKQMACLSLVTVQIGWRFAIGRRNKISRTQQIVLRAIDTAFVFSLLQLCLLLIKCTFLGQ